MNRGEMSFAEIPAFYRVMSTRAAGWLPDAVRERHQIGVDNLRLAGRAVTANGGGRRRQSSAKR